MTRVGGLVNFRKDINGLRALAVALVLLFHLNAPGFHAGFIGVDIFFVISGFLMTRIILGRAERQAFSLSQFYLDRFARIFPALAAMVGCTLAFGFAVVDPVALRTMGKHAAGALLFVSNVQFWLEAGYFDVSSRSRWFLHTWSLSVEWWFYMAYPLVLLTLRRVLKGDRAMAVALGVALLASLGLSVLAGLVPSGRASSFGFYMLPTRAWEMLAGALVALSPDRLRPRASARRAGVQLAGLALLALSLALYDQRTPWPTGFAVLPVVGAVLILAAGEERLFANRAVQWIGRASYSIYLWHWPVVVALAYFELQSPWARTAAGLASLGLGGLSHRFVEVPAQAWIKTSGRPRVHAAGLALAGVVLACLGGTVAALEGVPSRVRGDAALYADAAKASGEWAYPPACGGLSAAGEIKACTLGTPSKTGDVLIIGDSFAEMWFARAKALEPQLRDHAVVFATKAGCPPVPGLERKDPGFNCARFHRAVSEEAKKPRYVSVIYAGMWARYFSSEGPPLVNLEAASALRNLGSEISRLRSLGKHVTVIKTSPYPDVDVTEEMRRHAFLGDSSPPADHFDFQAVTRNSRQIEAGLAALQAQDVTVIDPVAALCHGTVCQALDHGRTIYMDGAHLRASYMAANGGLIDDQLLTPAPSFALAQSGPADPLVATGLARRGTPSRIETSWVGPGVGDLQPPAGRVQRLP